MNKRPMRPTWFSAASAAMMLLAIFGAVQAQEAQSPPVAAEAQSPPVAAARSIPFQRTLSAPCKERRIRLSGAFQVQYKITREAGGQAVIEGDINADKITGFGLTSRRSYRAVGVGRLESSGPAPTSFTYVFNFALNKSGSTDSLMGHVKFRISVNAGGGVTTSVLDANIDCTS